MTERSRGFQLRKSLINLIFPPACAHCDAPGELICGRCREELVWIQEPICGHCGQPGEFPTGECDSCLEGFRPDIPIRAACLYSGPLTRMIQRFKYENQFGLAETLAELMVSAWPAWQSPVDVIIPVPLHPERERKRGYNQATLLAQYLAERQGWEMIPAGLQRVRHTRPQVGLSAPERRDNVHDAFQADTQLVSGKRILLIDDVCTSGATLSSTADALKNAGAVFITGYCLARATASHGA